LDYALIQWDETQHLVGGLLLSRGQLQDYMQFSYYPPLFDVTTALIFKIMGPSVFSARLVALTFGILSVWAVFVVFIVVSVVYSLENAYYWVEKDHFYIPVKEAIQYVSENSVSNETTVVMFPVNYLSPDAVKFFLLTGKSSERELWEYPEDPVDVYKPVFNEAVLIQQRKTLNSKFLLLYEHGNVTYFQSDWKSGDVIDNLLNSGNFTLERIFGSYAHRIFIIRFLTKS
jgi:hypothetical protein